MKCCIPLQPVESAKIAAVGYDPERQRLAVQFKQKNGVSLPYEYENVTPEIYQQFIQSESKGRFFNQVLSDKEKFPFTKMVPDDEEPKAEEPPAPETDQQQEAA